MTEYKFSPGALVDYVYEGRVIYRARILKEAQYHYLGSRYILHEASTKATGQGMAFESFLRLVSPLEQLAEAAE